MRHQWSVLESNPARITTRAFKAVFIFTSLACSLYLKINPSKELEFYYGIFPQDAEGLRDRLARENLVNTEQLVKCRRRLPLSVRLIPKM